MRFLLILFSLLPVPLVVLAHIGEEIEEHPEAVQAADDVAQVSPVVVIIVLAAVVIIGGAVWWFILKKK